ncbi:MAG TPA: hypothetical protein VFF02_14125 [Anaeromyxobacteraceae bacterium]|nr:hypothetical protein [Anaeromyxobacteraceae bacterium]
MRTRLRIAALPSAALLAAALLPAPAGAWIYPEHRDIAVAAIARLKPADRDALERLWAEARRGHEARLCEKPSEGDQGLRPGCIDFAALPAIAGDHACSPRQLMETALGSDWILGVARVAAETKEALATAESRPQKLQRWATSNLEFQRVDKEYATRAGGNNAHFLLPRTGNDLGEFLKASTKEDAPLNALGLYIQYHLAALSHAQRLAATRPGEEHAELARQVVALEGFALHWIEDLYAAGHAAGTWGSAAWRKGTHDYYCEFGMDTSSWRDEPIVAYGDAYMRPADVERAAAALATAMGQLAAALRPGDALGLSAQKFGPGPGVILSFDSCKEMAQPSVKNAELVAVKVWDHLYNTPRPGRGADDAHLPRFREELGPFLGGFGTLGGGVVFGGYQSNSARGSGALTAGFRLGFGAESLTGSVGTGLAFVDVGLNMQIAQVDPCEGSQCAILGTNNLFPRVPSRTGLRLGLRLPFWLIPGDTLILLPVLALADKDAAAKVAVAAASGGLIPWQRSFRTGAGIFQLVLGREAQAVLYGYLGRKNMPLVVGNVTLPDGTTQLGVVQFKSVAAEFPVLEWTPFRTFATQLSFAYQLQLGFAVDIPVSLNVLAPAGARATGYDPAWGVFLRMQFDARYFMGSREDLEPPRG